MQISVKCSNGHKLRAPEKLFGKKIKCPKCAVVVRIPKAPDSDAIESRTKPADKTVKQKAAPPADESPDEFDDSEFFTDDDPAGSDPQDDFSDTQQDFGDTYDPYSADSRALPPKRGQQKKKKKKARRQHDDEVESDQEPAEPVSKVSENQIIAMGVGVGATVALLLLFVVWLVLPTPT